MTWRELPTRAGRFFFGTPRRAMWSVIVIALVAITLSSTLKHAIFSFVSGLFVLIVLIAVLGLVFSVTTGRHRRSGRR